MGEKSLDTEQRLRQAVEAAPDNAQPLYALGNFYQYQAHSYPEARAAYEKAIGIEPKVADYWIGLGNVLKNHFADYQATEQAYLKAIELNPGDDMPRNNIGNLYTYFLFDARKANAQLKRGLEIVPSDDLRRRGLLHWNYGGILSMTGDLEEAALQFAQSRDAFGAIEPKLDGDCAWWMHQSTLIGVPLADDDQQHLRAAAQHASNVYTRRYWWFYQVVFQGDQTPDVPWQEALSSVNNHHSCLLLMRHLYSLAGMQPQHREAMRPFMRDALMLWDSEGNSFADVKPLESVVQVYRRFRDGQSKGVGDPLDIAINFGSWRDKEKR